MNKGVVYREIRSAHDLYKQCASLYCEVWQEPPWNEFFEQKEVLEMMSGELNSPCTEGFVAVIGDEVAGFCWGFQVSEEKLLEISSGAYELLDIVEMRSIYYLSEICVAKKFRGQGIGKELHRRLVMKARHYGDIGIIIFRTNKQAHQARAVYTQTGFEDTGIEDGIHKDRTYWALDLQSKEDIN